MHNPFIVSIKCPECGAPLRYPEGTYTFKCAYCGSVLRTEAGARDLKYIITSSLGQREIALATKKILLQKGVKKLPVIKRITVIYKPFWYFKGMVYRVFANNGRTDVIGKTWSHSFEANNGFAPALSTLGVKTEALALKPYDSEKYKDSGVFLPLTVDRESVQKTAVNFAERNTGMDVSLAVKADAPGKKRISLWNSDLDFIEPVQDTDLRVKTPEAFSRVYMAGEKFFIIYYPVINVICKGQEEYNGFLLDGVSKALLDETDGARVASGEKTPEAAARYRVRLLTHRCKNCGHDLPPRDFDIIYFCGNCCRLWLLKGDGYLGVKLKVLDAGSNRNILYIPMWAFDVALESEKAGVALDSVGGLAGFMKMGEMILRDRDPAGSLRLFVPALVSRNAGALLKFSANISRMQKETPPASGSPDFLRLKVMNVSLPPEEAAEMLYPLVCSLIGRVDPQAMDFYSSLRIEIRKSELVWRPFAGSGYNYIDCFTRLSLPRRSLDVNVY